MPVLEPSNVAVVKTGEVRVTSPWKATEPVLASFRLGVLTVRSVVPERVDALMFRLLPVKVTPPVRVEPLSMVMVPIVDRFTEVVPTLTLVW